MEGYLKKWVNLRWQSRYFVLHDDILLYCEKLNGQIKGQIHLKVAALILVPEDPLLFIINTGTSEMHLRASTVAEKIKWVQALQSSQQRCLQQNGNSPSQATSQTKQIYDQLTDIWCTQALFDETMSNLIPKLEKNSELRNQAQKLEQLARNLKNKITQCTQLLEQEQKQLENQGNMIFNTKGINRIDYDDEDDNNFQEINENQTIFKSFLDQQSQIQLNNNPEVLLSLEEILAPIQYSQPIKYKNMISNKVFKNMKFTMSQVRKVLPRQQDPKEKLNIWKLMRDLIGKDLSKFAVPVYLNEPLSMLQRLSEQLGQYELLKKATQEEDSCLRLCYIMGFAVSDYATNINRHKKPFNPILGETFEYQHPDFTFISEQVSHHPPISAGYAYNNDFEFWGHTEIKSRFWGKLIEVHPQGAMHVRLKQRKDHFTFEKCVTKVQNVLFGELYLDHMGDMKFKNHTTKDSGILTLQERGWTDQGWHKMKGFVKDSTGIERYYLEGKWDTELIATNLQTQLKITIWKRQPLPPNSEWYYHFTEYAINLNHLNIDLIRVRNLKKTNYIYQKLPCTDCRLRPDQFALEMGQFDLAIEEKHRLEEKQRRRRKEMAEKQEVHIPRFFIEQDDEFGTGKVYIYKGNYWEVQKSNEEGLDIF